MGKRKFKIYWGFPILEGGKGEPPKKGISLLIALMSIALMMSVAGDMIVTSSVNLELSVANRDRVKAEYLAKSGLNLGIFLLTLSWGWDLFRAQPNAPAPVKSDLVDSDESMWSFLNSVPPIGAASVALMQSAANDENDTFNLKGIFNEKMAETMKLFEDQFSIKVSDESSRINVNDCSKGRCERVLENLIALFSCPAEKAFLETKTLTPEQLAYRIKDFISDVSNTSPESGFSDKNDPYRAMKPSYEIKGVPFDSVNELKLIAGWDDEIHAIFSPYLTVYPFNDALKQSSKININTTSRSMLGCLISEARSQSCAEKFNLEMTKMKSKGSTLSDAKNLKKAIKDLTCYAGQDDKSSADRSEWFDVKSSVFRFEITADTGNQSRKLEAVVRRIMPKDTSGLRNKQDVKRSYEILYWKLI